MAQELVQQKMQLMAAILIAGAIAVMIIPPAGANSPPPVTTMKVYFAKDMVPVTQPVKFTVNCSDFNDLRENRPGEMNELGDLFTYSALCPSYGCFDRIYHYMPYANLTSCDVIGELDGEQFTIRGMQSPFSCVVSKNWKTQTCEFPVNLTSARFTPLLPGATAITAVPPDRIATMETPAPEPEKGRGFFDDLICFWKNLLGGTCQDYP